MTYRKIANLHITNPLLHGDVVIFADGDTWFVFNDLSGYELRKDFNDWRTKHETIRNINGGMSAFLNALFVADELCE